MMSTAGGGGGSAASSSRGTWWWRAPSGARWWGSCRWRASAPRRPARYSSPPRRPAPVGGRTCYITLTNKHLIVSERRDCWLVFIFENFCEKNWIHFFAWKLASLMFQVPLQWWILYSMSANGTLRELNTTLDVECSLTISYCPTQRLTFLSVDKVVHL